MVKSIEWKNNKLVIIDQTKLPLELEYIETDDFLVLIDAIKKLKVRGAPLLGAVSAFTIYFGIKNHQGKRHEFIKRLDQIFKMVAKTRPTAINLFWAIERIKKLTEENFNKTIPEIKDLILKEAISIMEDDEKRCEKIGLYGSELIKDEMNILTHCNTGALATCGIGTAFGIIYTAFKQGKKIKVYADETRPLLQGARLTMWELMQNGISAILITDNTAGFLMKQKKVDCVIVGADRIALNGDTANKIGTYSLAVLARKNEVPFYVAAPVSTFDFSLKSGDEIPIEERNSEEITEGFGKRTTPLRINVYNPAFDVTPNELITAIITEKGILRPPFKNIDEVLKSA